jgi:orotate phosphoribosyltransferase
MRLYCPGYAAWKFDKNKLAQRLEAAEAGLARAAEDGLYVKGKTLLAVIGTSGSWLAPLMLQAGHRVALVRKPGDSSHGSDVEAAESGPVTERPKAVLLDDFIATGDTVRNAAAALWNLGIPLVAVVTHDDTASHDPSIRIRAGSFDETIAVYCANS